MRRLRPRTAVLGGAAIGLVAGAVAFGATSSTTVTSPVSKPASFTKQVPVSVAKPPPPVRPKKAPCARNQQLEDGVCIVHVERVVVRHKPAPPVQALSRQEDQAAAPAQRSQEPEKTSSAPAHRSQGAEPVEHQAVQAEHEAEPREHEDTREQADAPDHEAAGPEAEQQTESED